MPHTRAKITIITAAAALALSGCADVSDIAERGKQAYSSASAAVNSDTSSTASAPTARADVGITPTPQQQATPQEIATAKELLPSLPVQNQDSSGYKRTAQFGAAWSYDYDGNKCRTRDDILSRDMPGAQTSNGCTVTSGTLEDPYTGKTIHFSKSDADAVQIDHVVALNEAWGSGARAWNQQTREQFANDPANLMAVDGPTNTAKSNKDAAQFVPDNQGFVCTYVTRQVTLKAHYGLSVDKAEAKALHRYLDAC